MSHSKLRVAICHFHLRTGGVTRVIEHALEALADRNVSIAVLSGEAPAKPLPAGIHCQVIPGLAYEETRAAVDGKVLAAQMQSVARDVLGASPDVWHVHNHSLGKNLAAPLAIRTLAGKNRKILLHIHDFCEDGRPALYKRLLSGAADGDQGRLSELLYPLAEQIHYAVLNGRDQSNLIRAGIPRECIHLLPNAVWLPRRQADISVPLPFDPRQRLWLYPTRAIRRKNLGELLFWAALGTDQDLFATTQAPQNPAERPVYTRWKAFAEDHKLPVAFELGMRYKGDFLRLLQSAHALVSTSITEGFGLAFLEPWLVGRPLAGRDLPEITSDFAELGVDLGVLYHRLPIPLNWIDAEQLRTRIDAGLERSMEAYSRTANDLHRQRAWNTFVQDGQVDLGRLDEPLQEAALRRLMSSPQARLELSLREIPLDVSEQRVAKNRKAIVNELNLMRYGDRLLDVYRQLTAGTASPLSAADGSELLNAFLAPERLFLLKT
jgi:glycosyltransferase involved in cell wall biosynthesis